MICTLDTPCLSQPLTTMSSVDIGSEIPDFEADTTTGRIRFHEWLGGSWAILFSELSEVQNLMPFWEERGVKPIALSCDDVDSHKGWLADIAEYNGGQGLTYPIIADPTRDLSVLLGMLDKELKDELGMPLTVRKVFVIGPDRKVKVILTYPPIIGRNFDEIKRIVQALQVVASGPVSTPVNWCPGKRVMILPGVSADDAAAKFPGHTVHTVPSGKTYLRSTEDPSKA